MNKSIACIIFVAALIVAWLANPTEAFVVDHSNLYLFDEIPEVYILAAQNLHMMFADRSVGANINDGLNCLASESDEVAINSCKRYVHPDARYSSPASEVNWYRVGGYNRTNWDFYGIEGGITPALPCAGIQTSYWYETVECFITYVDNNPTAYQVYSYQVSYLSVAQGSDIANITTGYFVPQANRFEMSDIETMVARHPTRTFIYWTSSLARPIGTQASTDFNNQMRQFAATNNELLIDAADILSHDPWGNPCYDNRDGVQYCTQGGNCENHTDDGINRHAICQHYTTETEGGHLGSTSAGKIRVAKGVWIMMAYIAGWRPGGEPVPDTTPPVISSVSSILINQTSATITWSTNEASDTQIDYGLTAGYGNQTTLNTAMITSHSQQITGLNPATTYHYRVRSRDGAGNLATLGGFTFTTLAAQDITPPSQVTGLTATPHSSTQINLSWNVATDNVGVAGYRVYRNIVNVANTTATNYQSTGLVANTSYNYTVAAYDAAGNLGLSSVIVQATTSAAPDTTPPARSNGTPTGILAAGTNQTILTIRTNEQANCRYSNNTATAYASMLGTFTGGGCSAGPNGLSCTHSSATIILSSGQNYTYYVRCSDTSGNVNLDDFSILFSVVPSPIEGDSNGDGSVNILDIQSILIDWGKTSGYDSNNDLAPPFGVIDIFDVMVVVINWGRSS